MEVQFQTLKTGRWIEVGSLDDIPPLGARVVESPLGNIAVFRTADDQVFALYDRCPHKGGPLSQGIVHGTKVTCPLHNWHLDLCSGNALPPDEGCTQAFRVKLDGRKIFLEL